jgi:hypothetical protein
MLSYFAINCGPGDGSTLNPLGEPLGPPELGINVTENNFNIGPNKEYRRLSVGDRRY